MTTNPTPDRVTAIYDAICAFQRTHRTGGGLQHAPIRALLAEHLARALPAVVPGPPATRAADRDRIAAAMREHYLCTDRNEADADGNLPCRCGDWREPGAEADDENDWDSHLAAAVLAVLPPPVDRAAVLREAADAPAAECSAQHHRFDDGRLCIRAAQHRGDHIDERGYHWSDTVAIYPLADEAQQPEGDERSAGVSALTDKLKRVRALHHESCILARGEIGRTAFKCGMCEALDAPTEGGARRAADDEQPDETRPESCAHCGKAILRRSGTLSVWWVHDPGGHTMCVPTAGGDSPCATPKPAARGRQDDPPVVPCPPGCVACATDESHDPAPAAGARQDGAPS